MSVRSHHTVLTAYTSCLLRCSDTKEPTLVIVSGAATKLIHATHNPHIAARQIQIENRCHTT
jgi:hypothetical protein